MAYIWSWSQRRLDAAERSFKYTTHIKWKELETLLSEDKDNI
jgi:hypothetical protein